MCDMCGWEDVLDKIEEMQSKFELHGFAGDTLAGISEWIQDNEHVTPSQITAIDNIENSKGV